MKLPFQARFIPTDRDYTVEAVTDTGLGRFYWVRSKHGHLVPVPRVVFA